MRALVKTMQDNGWNKNHGFLLDGWHKNRGTYEYFKAELSKFVDVRLCIYYKCEISTLVKRINDRALKGERASDSPLVIKKRMESFERDFLPIHDLLVKDFKVEEINCEADIDTVKNITTATLE